VRIGDIAKSEKKHTVVFVLDASVQIVSSLVRIPKRFQEAFTIGFGLNGHLWHPNTPSNISAPRRRRVAAEPRHAQTLQIRLAALKASRESSNNSNERGWLDNAIQAIHKE
jgi:hypothetical protein